MCAYIYMYKYISYPKPRSNCSSPSPSETPREARRIAARSSSAQRLTWRVMGSYRL